MHDHGGVNLSCTGITIAAASSFSDGPVSPMSETARRSATRRVHLDERWERITASTPTVITVQCPGLTISKTPDGGTVNAAAR